MPFRRGKLKVRLRAPQAVRRFIHEQRIRVRLSRARLKKSPSFESGSASEAAAKPETSIVQRLLLKTGMLPGGAADYRAELRQFEETDTKPHPNPQSSTQSPTAEPDTDPKPGPSPGPISQPTTHTRSKSSPTAKTTTPAATALPEESATSTTASTTTTTSTSTTAAAATVRALTALLLGVILFISPLYCFTSSRQPIPIYIFIALAFAVFGFYKISRGELKFIRSPLDTAVFLLPGLALLSSIGAWDTGEAVNLALLLSCCAVLYWIVSSVVDSLEAIYAILTVFTASAAAAAVLCLPAVFQEGAAYHFAEALGALSVAALLITFYLRTACQRDTASCQSNRTVFQNWAAALHRNASQNNTTTFQSSTASQNNTTHQNHWLHPALSAAGYLTLLSITGINSPVFYLILILGIPLSLWKLPGGERKKGIAHFIIYASMAFLAAGKVGLCLQSGAVTAGWVWAALGLMLVLALEYSLIIYQKSGRRLKPWVLPAAFALLAVLLLTSSTAYLRSTPSHAANQPARHDAHYYIVEKLLKGRDALRVMASSPRTLLQGTGGGGWEPLSYQHQSFYYQDPPPGAFFQAGVEMGLPGLITLLALWILFFKVIKRTTAQSALAEELNGTAWAARAPWAADTPSAAESAWPILTAALVIGCCSLWHCTLSTPAVSLVLFTLFGLGQALDSTSIPKRPRYAFKKKLPQYLLIGGAVLIVIIISLNIYAGESSAITARQALSKGDSQAALINYEKAVEKDPLNATYRKELGKLYLESLKLASHHFQKGVHLARGDAELRVLYASTLFQSGQPEEGVRHLETAVLLRPLEQEFYEDLALGYVTAGRLLLEKPTRSDQSAQKKRAHTYLQKDMARPYLLRAKGIPQLLEKRKAQINKRHLRYWSGAPYLGITPKIQLYCGQAAVLLGDQKAALHYLEQAAQDASLKEEAELWLGLIPPPDNTNPCGDTSYSSSCQGSP